MRRIFSTLATTAVCAVFLGCSSSDSSSDSTNDEVDNKKDGGVVSDTGGRDSSRGSSDGSSNDSFINLDSNTADLACEQQSAEATIENRPIDIIFVIDNSGSMSEEISEVQKQINKNFANIINNAVPAIDYRVVMVSDYGGTAGSRYNLNVCVAQPLGGVPDTNNDGQCDTIPAKPVNTAKFFHHAVNVQSWDAWCRLIQYFNTADRFNLQPNGYSQVLRPDAFKFLVVISDDNSNCTIANASFRDRGDPTAAKQAANDFDIAIRTLSPEHFGPLGGERNYSFWSIVALAPYNNTGLGSYGDPHPPDESIAPITTATCTPGAAGNGIGHQALSVLTGGYRFPTCGLDFTKIFKLMAEGVIKGAQVPCEFDIPPDPENGTLDLTTVQLAYSSQGTLVKKHNQVATADACNADSFYIADNKIKLCPQACQIVQADENAKLDVLYGCALDVK